MTNRTHSPHADRGAALILAIGFMVLVGLIVGGLAALITSGAGDTVSLGKLRDRQYAADAAVQQGIVQVRAALTADNTAKWCASNQPIYTDVNTTSLPTGVRLGCTQTAKLSFTDGALYSQNNVVFEVCTDTTKTCNDASTTLVLRAEVNFSTTQPNGQPSTFIQSWSVFS